MVEELVRVRVRGLNITELVSEATSNAPYSDDRSSFPPKLLVPAALSSASGMSTEAEFRATRISSLVSRQQTPTRWERAYQDL